MASKEGNIALQVVIIYTVFMRNQNSKIIVFGSLLMSLLTFGCAFNWGVNKNRALLINKTFANYSAFYDLELFEVNVKNNLRVNGRSNFTNCLFNNIYLNGKTEIHKTTIAGIASINGDAKITTSMFLGKLEFNGKLLDLNSVIIKGPIIANVLRIIINNSTIKQDIIVNYAKNLSIIIELSHNTNIFGSIQFQNGLGKVLLDNSSKVHGQIINGKTEIKQVAIVLKK